MSEAVLSSLLLDGAAADRPFAWTSGEVVSLGRFRADVAAAARVLEANGWRRGLVACEDAYWATVGWFALAHSGGEIVFPANTLPATLESLRSAYDHVLTDGAVPVEEKVHRLTVGADAPATLPAMDANRTTLNFFTSGSTGEPKRITKTVRQLELEAVTVDRVLGLRVPPGAWVHGTVAHQHLYGLTFRLCWPIASRRPFHGAIHLFWEPLLKTLPAGAALVSSPSHLARLDGMPPLPADRRPSAVLSAGAPLPEDGASATQSVLGCPVSEFFGSTEAGVIANRLRGAGMPPPWSPMPGVGVSRLGDGRLHVRSPYVEEPEGQDSEDLIELTGDGRFVLLGRADRIAKIEGVRVNLAEFESRLAALDGVDEAAIVVLGATMPHLGAVVVLDEAGRRELAEAGPFRLGRRLRSDLARSLPAAALPRRWRFVPRLPAGPIGKPPTAELVALFEAT
jgi:acyl-coenzyme A synthetase/AMP-(fatty) acid ligase